MTLFLMQPFDRNTNPINLLNILQYINLLTTVQNNLTQQIASLSSNLTIPRLETNFPTGQPNPRAEEDFSSPNKIFKPNTGERYPLQQGGDRSMLQADPRNLPQKISFPRPVLSSLTSDQNKFSPVEGLKQKFVDQEIPALSPFNTTSLVPQPFVLNPLNIPAFPQPQIEYPNIQQQQAPTRFIGDRFTDLINLKKCEKEFENLQQEFQNIVENIQRPKRAQNVRIPVLEENKQIGNLYFGEEQTLMPEDKSHPVRKEKSVEKENIKISNKIQTKARSSNKAREGPVQLKLSGKWASMETPQEQLMIRTERLNPIGFSSITDETTIKESKIRVGSNYQTEVPDYNFDQKRASEKKLKLVWDPSSITEEGRLDYLNKISQVTSERVQNEEKALKVLSKFKMNINDAINHIKQNVIYYTNYFRTGQRTLRSQSSFPKLS